MQSTMPSQSPRPRPSFDDLYRRIEALPEGVTGQILEPGVLTTMSRPGLPHAHSESLIDDWLRRFDARRGGTGWWILREMEVRFPGDLLAVPDLAGWRVDRVATLPRDNPMTVLPDWCCEVLSASTARADRVLKLPLYARGGVRWVWLVDPEARFVEVYETVGERPVRVAGATDEASLALPPFEGEAPIATWWMPET
jgi:Uma2 family endonuclease